MLWSTATGMNPAEHGRRLVELLPEARLVEFDSAGVLLMVDEPERVAAEIGTFLRSTCVEPGETGG